MQVLRFPFVNESTRRYPLPIQCAEVSDNFGAMNGQWVRVHTTQNLAQHAFPMQSDQLCNFSFWTSPTIYSPCMRPSETTLTNMASIERQINRLSRVIKLDEYKSRIKEI